MQPDPRPARAWRFLALLVLWLPAAAGAQETSASQPLPTVAEVAAALADPVSRAGASLELVAVAALRQRLAAGGVAGEAVAALEADRGWLDSLQARFGPAASRSPVLDPAAWHLQRQLDTHGLEPGPLVPALGPDFPALLGQLFTRTDPRQAVAVLPQSLWHVEGSGTQLWSALLALAAADPALDAALRERGFAALRGTPPAKAVAFRPKDWQALALEQLTAMSWEAAAGPADPQRPVLLRFGLLSALPGLPEREQFLAGIVLHFADLLDGLGEARYIRFTEGLLGCVAALNWLYHQDPAGGAGALTTWLSEAIGRLSTAFAPEFNRVDPRLNSGVAAAFDVTRSLARGASDAQNHQQIADAVARLALLVPDMDFYFDLPVRDTVAGGVDACAGIVAVRDPDGSPAMTRAVFDDCQRTLVQLADMEAREAHLAGDQDGPFGESELERELELTPTQRINYGIGYLNQRYATGCSLPARPLPNPLEWAYLASFMAWLAEQAPVFFQTPENQAQLARMRAIGGDLVNLTGEQVDCVAGAGAAVNDPVARATRDYAQVLQALGRSLREADQAWRSGVLAPGADIALDAGPAQGTAWRPSSVAIGPCDAAQVCEMSGELSATRAMFGLFPDAFLVAAQSGMGEVEICYGNMEWVDRRAAPVRKDDPNVANYHGHLAFDLRGRYVDAEGEVPLFGFRFRSPEEHHYMFAADSPEVLEDSCPEEWLGKRIVSSLGARGSAIVPDRLTYLSAPRALPSRLLARNWDRGAEWRDWFVTGLGVEVLPVEPPPDLSTRLGQHLRGLYREGQDRVYLGLLGETTVSGGTAITSPGAELQRLGNAKSVLRMMSVLFYPQTLQEEDPVRAALAGQQGLLDVGVLQRMREDNEPAGRIAADASQRLQQFQQDWQALPEGVRRNGSVPESVAHALARLNALHAKYFQAAGSAASAAPTGD